MITFRFIGSVDYSEDLHNKKAQIGDVCHVMYSGKRTDIRHKIVNSLYCYIDSDWSIIEGNSDEIYYVVETFVRINGFYSDNSDFKTDTIVALAEVNKTKGTVECCSIWPEIMNSEKLRWEISDEIHHCMDAGRIYTTMDGISAPAEYTRQIDEVLSKRNSDF